MSDRELESLQRQSDALEKRILEFKGRLTPRVPRGTATSRSAGASDKHDTGGIKLLNRACEFVAEGAPDGAQYLVPLFMFVALPFVLLGSLALSVLLMAYVLVFLPVRGLARFVSRLLSHDPRP